MQIAESPTLDRLARKRADFNREDLDISAAAWRAKHGGDDEFNSLFNALQGRIAHLSRRYRIAGMDEDDIRQELAITLKFDVLRHYNGGSFFTLCYRCFRHRLYDLFRTHQGRTDGRTRKRPVISFNPFERLKNLRLYKETKFYDFEQSIDRNYFENFLLRILNPQQRRVFKLLLLGHSPAKISQKLHLRKAVVLNCISTIVAPGKCKERRSYYKMVVL